MRSVLEKDPPEDREERRWVRGTLLTALLVGVVAGSVVIVQSFLAKPVVQKRSVQNVAILRQPPPPPPPKPPEKPPEPPKLKDEVKIPEPKLEPKPDEPKPADDKPPADKPLGVDAEAGAGSDGFGLAANKGGRDITTLGASAGGGGLGGAYYSGLLQRQFFEAMSRNRKVLRDEFRVVVKIWVGDDGRVQKAEVVSSSGNVQVDEQIQVTLLDMAPLRDVPPSSMRPIQLRLSNRS